MVEGGVLTVRFAVRAERIRIIGAGYWRKGRPSMSKRIVYRDEPIKIGGRVGQEILPGHGGARTGAGRPPAGNQPVTLRLPPKILASARREAKRAGQSLSEFVAARLQKQG